MRPVAAALATAGLALMAATPAAAGGPVYKWSSETRSFSYTKKVCNRDPYTVTEIVTQEIFHRASGVSAVGAPGTLPRGSSQSTGRIRRSYSKVVQGPDPAPPEDYTITEALPLVPANWGAVNRTRDGQLVIDAAGADKAPRFAGLRRGKSITLRLDQPTKPGRSDDGTCVIDSTGTLTGTVTITRIR